MAEPEPTRRELRGLVVRGIGWMMASQGATQVLALATSVVIARFLSPREVGLAAMATVFGTLALIILDFGFAAALVQRPNLSEEDASTAFWAGMALALGLTIIGVGLSWPIASLYGEPRVQRLFAVLSLTFLLTGPGIVPGAILTRDLRFRSLEVRTIIATASACILAMALAVVGVGPWAIIAQSLTVAGISTLLLWRSSPWRPQARFSRESLRSMSAYTWPVFGSRTLNWANLNLDNFLVGRFLGAAPLGAYSIAFAMALTPFNRIAIPVAQVFFPAFSKLRERAAVAAGWLRAVRMLAFVIVPLMLGLVVVAPDFVHVVFGPKWRTAAPVMQILAPIGLMQALTWINFGVLQALAMTRLLFRVTVVITVLSVAAFAAGLPWGIRGVAMAYLLISAVLQPGFVWMTTRALGVPISAWLRSVAGVFEAGVAMLVIVLVERDLLISGGVAPAGRLIAAVLTGAAAYLALIVWRAPEVRRELRSALTRRAVTPVAQESGPAAA